MQHVAEVSVCQPIWCNFVSLYGSDIHKTPTVSETRAVHHIVILDTLVYSVSFQHIVMHPFIKRCLVSLRYILSVVLNSKTMQIGRAHV